MMNLPRLTGFVRKLIVTLLVAFIVEIVAKNFMNVDLYGLLILDPSAIGPQTLWQVFTYVLVEPPQNAMWFLINLLFMWWILSPFEVSFGSQRTFRLAAAATLGSGVAALLVGALIPVWPGVLLTSTPIAYAGIAAMCEVNRGMPMSFFGAIPMTTSQLIWVIVGMSVLQFLVSPNLVMLTGSLAAIAIGIGFVRYMRRPRKPRSAPKPKSRFQVIEGGRTSDPESDKPRWLN